MNNRPVCLIIRDGWGQGREDETNAIYTADTPGTDRFMETCPSTIINTSGIHVGLPEGYQGNSEVGHLNIGAGRVVYQNLTRIDKAVEDGSFYSNRELLEAVDTAKKRGSTLHLIGLIQEEGVHAVTRHCRSLLKLCKQQGFDNVVIHAITDGRDTPPSSAPDHLKYLSEGIEKYGRGRIVTLIGRYFAMDRDKRWDRTEIAYRAIMKGEGKQVPDVDTGIKEAYDNGETDEFIKPRIIDYKGAGKDDVMILFNFRFDRTRQLTKAIAEKDFNEFERVPHNIRFTAMTHYYDNGSFHEAFPEMENKNILGEMIAKKGLMQLRSAETEKFAHVTFFFNSLQNEPFKNEERILVDSPREVATYDLKPEMSAFKVRDKLLEAIESDRYDAIITNFANGDMVGHTGVHKAIEKAVETVDTCVTEVVNSVLDKGGICIVFADHGNADQTKLDDGSPMTAHTVNPVPLFIAGAGDLRLREGGSLCDVAPTMLELMGLEQPE
ncbi:MAG: 2,3-bisphosphoglycerate-independent phosphoglycerate mutase, partial [Chitinivibrionales bacterium]